MKSPPLGFAGAEKTDAILSFAHVFMEYIFLVQSKYAVLNQMEESKRTQTKTQTELLCGHYQSVQNGIAKAEMLGLVAHKILGFSLSK